MPRRVPDYPDAYRFWNLIASFGSLISTVASLFFFYVVYVNLVYGRKGRRNPWNDIYADSKRKFFETTYGFLKRHPEHFQYTKERGWQVLSAVPIVGFDVAVDRQINFQNPATLVMDGIIDLHHDVMTFLIVILVIVSYILFSALANFRETAEGRREFVGHGAITRHVNHHQLLEVI